jgi:hypothetical protein
MKTLRWLALAALVCAPAACSWLTTPDPDEVLVDEQFAAWVDSFGVPDSTAAGSSIAVTLSGTAGSDGSYHLERIDQELQADGWHVMPIAHHFVERDKAYPQAFVPWSRTLLLAPPHAGWVRVHVLSHEGVLVDSTYVSG